MRSLTVRPRSLAIGRVSDIAESWSRSGEPTGCGRLWKVGIAGLWACAVGVIWVIVQGTTTAPVSSRSASGVKHPWHGCSLARGVTSE